MKKYRTVIEVVCEANSKGEALDVAGEYLRGSIGSGVLMRCKTAPVCSGTKIALSGLMVFTILAAGILSTNLALTNSSSVAATGFDACQAPLKTTLAGKAKSDFQYGWREQELSKALKHITQ